MGFWEDMGAICIFGFSKEVKNLATINWKNTF